ncbi:exopolysaccharide biosynthesis protein [Pseudaminobacter sp. NGMCC 1.201702]
MWVSRLEPEGDVLPTSEVLRRLAERAEAGEVSVADIADIAGRRTHAAILALVALPEALPLPVVGMSTALSIPLIIVSAHMAAFGAGGGIPKSLERRKLPASLVRVVAGRASSFLKRVERISKPRLRIVADRSRILAAMCLLLAAVIALPIPFGNLPPAICVLLMAVGMVQKDGALAAAGFAGGFVILGGSVFAADYLIGFFQA